MNKSLKEKALQYNAELKEGLSLIYNELNHGQRQKIVKNEKVKALLLKYKITEG